MRTRRPLPPLLAVLLLGVATFGCSSGSDGPVAVPMPPTATGSTSGNATGVLDTGPRPPRIDLEAGVPHPITYEVSSVPQTLDGELTVVEVYPSTFHAELTTTVADLPVRSERLVAPAGHELVRIGFRTFERPATARATTRVVLAVEGQDDVTLRDNDAATAGWAVAVPEGAAASLQLVETVTALPLGGLPAVNVPVEGDPIEVRQSFDLRTGQLGDDVVPFYRDLRPEDRTLEAQPAAQLDCELASGEGGCRVFVESPGAGITRFQYQDQERAWGIGDEGSGTVTVRLLPRRTTTGLDGVADDEGLGTWTAQLLHADGTEAAEPEPFDAASGRMQTLYLPVDDLGDLRYELVLAPTTDGQAVTYGDEASIRFDLAFAP